MLSLRRRLRETASVASATSSCKSKWPPRVAARGHSLSRLGRPRWPSMPRPGTRRASGSLGGGFVAARPEGEKTTIIGAKRALGQLLWRRSIGRRFPAAAQRLEQRRRVGVPRRLRRQGAPPRRPSRWRSASRTASFAHAARPEALEGDPVALVGPGDLLGPGRDRLARRPPAPAGRRRRSAGPRARSGGSPPAPARRPPPPPACGPAARRPGTAAAAG